MPEPELGRTVLELAVDDQDFNADLKRAKTTAADLTGTFGKIQYTVRDASAAFAGLNRTLPQTNTFLDGINRQVARFDGANVATEAKQLAMAITQVGGVSKLTASEQALVNRELTEMIAKLRATGQAVPSYVSGMQEATVQQSKVASGLTGLTGLLTRFVGPMAVGLAIKQTVEWADRTTETAQALGMTTTRLQQVEFAAKRNGASVDQLSSSVASLNDRLANGDKSTLGALEKLGLDYRELESLSPDEQMLRIGDALGTLRAGGEQTSVAMDLFGRSGARLIPVLTNLREEMARAPVVTEDQVQALGELQDAWDAAKSAGVAFLSDVIGPLALRYQMLAQAAAAANKAMGGTGAASSGPGNFLQRGIEAAGPLWTQMLPGLGGSLDISAVKTQALRDYNDQLDRMVKDLNLLPMTEEQRKAAILILGGVRVPGLPKAPAWWQATIAKPEAPTIPEPPVMTEEELRRLEYLERIAKLQQELFGYADIARAREMVDALGAVSNLSKLSADRQDELRKAVLAALAAFDRLGQRAPADLQKVLGGLNALLPTGFEDANKNINWKYLTGGPYLEDFLPSTVVNRLQQYVPNILDIPVNRSREGVKVSEGPATGAAAWFGPGGFLSSLPSNIMQAIMGGGKIGQTIGSTVGQGVGSWLVSAKGPLSSISKVAGGLFSTLLPGIGSLLGPVVDWIGGLFGGGKEWKQVKEMRGQYQEAAGGLDALNQAAVAAGTNLDAFLRAKTVADFQTAVKNLEGAIGKAAEKAAKLASLEAERAALIAKQAPPGWEEMAAIGSKYGVDPRFLGATYAGGKAADLLEDLDRFAKGGGDQGALIAAMGPAASKLIADAIATGTALPENFRWLAEEMSKRGLLIDETGKTIDLAAVTWGEAVKTASEILQGSIDELTRAIDELNGTIKAQTAPATGGGGGVDTGTIQTREGPRTLNPLDGELPGPTAMDASFEAMHRGGLLHRRVVGATLSSLSQDWQRAHGGLFVGSRALAANEVPIIAEAGEGVLSRDVGMRSIGQWALAAMNRGQSAPGDSTDQATRVINVTLQAEVHAIDRADVRAWLVNDAIPELRAIITDNAGHEGEKLIRVLAAKLP